jgi:hypothetical protein
MPELDATSLLARTIPDLERIEEEVAQAAGDLSVLACLLGMALSEARDQLALTKPVPRRAVETEAKFAYQR